MFRAAGWHAAMCSGVSIVDTFRVTDTTFADDDAPDVIHSGKATTLVEALMLLNLVCPRPDGSYMRPATPDLLHITLAEGYAQPDTRRSPSQGVAGSLERNVANATADAVRAQAPGAGSLSCANRKPVLACVSLVSRS